MQRLCTAILVMLGFAHPALALSCLKPDAVRSYLEANASEDRWGAVVGRLDFDESRLPPAVSDGGHDDVELRAQLVGNSLGVDGFKDPFQGHVSLRIQCFGSWCGHPDSGRQYLVFIKRENGRHIAISDPCESWLFPEPRRKTLDALQRCFRGGYCQPEDDD